MSKISNIKAAKITAFAVIMAAIITGSFMLASNRPTTNQEVAGNERHAQLVNNSPNSQQGPIVQNSENITIQYTNSKNPNYLNKRNDEVRGLKPMEIVKSYFATQNSKKYSLACSLLPKKKCDSDNGEDISKFSGESMKYINGYENIKIWDPEIPDNKSMIICAKYSYILKSDLNPNEITEILSFYLDKREDSEWEMTSRVCEKKFKEGKGIINCPHPASKQYCI